jgi:SAM-dependent methyltransferase
MRLDTRLLLALNRCVRRPNLPGRVAPSEYAAWEYNEAARHVRMMEEAGVSLAVRCAVDLGCGLGGKSVYVAERGPERLVGLDIREVNVRAARAFASTRGITNAYFTTADAARLPLGDGAVDLVVTTDTFEHFPEPAPVVAEIARVLRPGGRLAALFGPFGSPLGSHLYEKIYVPWCHVLFAREALAEAIREIARRRGARMDAEDAAEEARVAEEQIAYYDADVNRMSLRRFARLLRSEPRLAVRVWRKHTPDKLRGLSPLLRAPGLDELLTGILVVVAERR